MWPFHTHRWLLAEMGHYRRHIFNSQGSDITICLYRCSECGKVDTRELEGHWSRSALEG